MRTHPFYAGDHTTHRGELLCEFCGSPKSFRVHQMPEVSDDVTELESRRLGEAGSSPDMSG